MTRAPLILAALLATTAAHAADIGDGPSSSACIPNVIRSEQMLTWDTMAVPTSLLSIHGFQLAHYVRTAVVNDDAALPVVLGLPFDETDWSAVATGLGRAACVCERGGNTTYGAMIRKNAETRGERFGNAFMAAVNQCLNPVPYFGGPRGGRYGNVSPTKIGVPNS